MSVEFEGRNRELLEARPRPLVDAASITSKITGSIGTVVTMLVGWGLVSLVQQDVIEGLLGLLPGLVTSITSVLTAFGVVRRAEPLVTPLSDPRDDRRRPLVALGPEGRADLS